MSLLEADVGVVRRLLNEQHPTSLDLSGERPAPKTAHAGLILKTETYAELGSPETSSAQLVLYSNEAGEDAARLIGPDLSRLSQNAASFAEVVILKGPSVDAETYYQFTQRHQRLFDAPGWMVKAAGGRLWVRAGRRDPAPTFEAAAATLIARTHEAFPQVQGVEVWFITKNDPLVARLFERAQTLQTAARQIKENIWKARGFDYRSCQLAGHCGSCSDKKTCASVRQMQARVRIKRRTEAVSAEN